ncbi:MAG TPA: hypothetical protein VF793_15075, partial [Telluria sp.]
GRVEDFTEIVSGERFLFDINAVTRHFDSPCVCKIRCPIADALRAACIVLDPGLCRIGKSNLHRRVAICITDISIKALSFSKVLYTRASICDLLLPWPVISMPSGVPSS